MTASPPSLARSRSAWSVGGTVAVHAALALLTMRQPVQELALRVSVPRAIEFQLRARSPNQSAASVRVAGEQAPTPKRLASLIPQKRPLPMRPAASTLIEKPPVAPRLPPAPPPRPTPDSGAPPGPQARSEATPPNARDLGKVDLLPQEILRRHSESGTAAAPSQPGQGEGALSPQAATARLARERIQGFLDTELARNRVQSGLIDPIWRDLEASILEQFKPAESLVRSGQSSMTLGQRVGNQISSVAKQILGSPGRVEKATLPRGEFAERGPLGLPENAYRNGLAAQQSKAVVDAWKQPASWRRTEVELIIGADGELESIRVVNSCGAKKLDAVAVAAIEQSARKQLASYRGKRTLTTWAVESAYAANVPFAASTDETGTGVGIIGVQGGFKFDETGLGRKNARGAGKYLSDPEYLVGGNIRTRVSLLTLRETSE